MIDGKDDDVYLIPDETNSKYFDHELFQYAEVKLKLYNYSLSLSLVEHHYTLFIHHIYHTKPKMKIWRQFLQI